jgi:hypothetical protein
MSDNNEKFNFDKKLYTEDDIKNDPSAEVVDMTTESIPDIEQLTEKVVKLLEFIDDPTIVELEKTDNTKYFQTVNSQFEDLPYSIIKLLTERENRDTNLEKLLDMFAIMQTIKNGEKDITSAFTDYKEELNEEYVYPKFGGKEEFERKMNKKKKKAERRKFHK